MLLHASVSMDLWTNVINTTYYLVNKLSSMKIENKTPFEVRFGSVVDYKHLAMFKYPLYAHLNNDRL